MGELAVAISSSLFCIWLGCKVLEARSKEDGCVVVPCRPSTVLLAATGLRYLLGGWIVMLMGWLFGAPEGEYDQYIVTFEQGYYSIIVWSTSLILAIAVYKLADRLLGKKDNQKALVLGRDWLNNRVSLLRIKWVFWLSISLKLGYVVASSVLGSEDRGESYTYWALMEWKPTAGLIAINRVLDLCYVLTPLVVATTTSQRIRLSCIFCIALSIGMMSVWGGRGEILYPVVYVGVGTFGAIKRGWLKGVFVVILAVCTVSLPVMSAIRDMPEFERLSGVQRISLIGKVFENDSSIKKRVQTIGRDIYACSDGFIYRDRMSEAEGFGKDLGPNEVIGHMIPKIFGGTSIKNDGSVIAQRYMGSNVSDWFPCITFPADAFRRFRWGGVLVGSCVFSLITFATDRVWSRLRKISTGSWALLMVLLPITFLRTAPTGTVKEILGIYPWELLKYTIVCIVVGWLIDKLSCQAWRNSA